MTPQDVILNLVLGVAGNGLFGMLGVVATGVTKSIKQSLSPSVLTVERPTFRTLVNEAAKGLAEVASFGDIRLKSFLSSQETLTVIHQLYASRLAKDGYENNISSIRKQFIKSFSLYLNVPEHEIKERASTLFDWLVRCCEGYLEVAIEEGVLSSHEAMSSYRHAVVRDALASIEKRLEYLTGLREPRLDLILDFERQYREQVAERHRFITPPHFDKRIKMPVNDLYVAPRLMRRTSQQQQARPISTAQFMSTSYRSVILGNPGAGKSTFAEKLCYDLASRYTDRLFGGRLVTPILVTLREYGEQKKAKSCSILQFISESAVTDYQLSLPDGAFEYLLRSGRVLVIFDGLDELVDTYDRDKVSRDIQSFCHHYSLVPVVVTSRIVGYDQAPLDPKIFEVLHLAPFNDKQIKEYAVKWFSCDDNIPPEQRKLRASQFFQESTAVPDLRSNPLMLALMCNIYWGENYIPKNRPELYRKCAEMLFERWDKHRRIAIPSSFEAHLDSAIRFIAYQVYSRTELQKGVSEDQLVSLTADYLCDESYEDRAEGERAARDFIQYCCKGRAWVFSDTGLKLEGESLYEFTHRSFLEFFTAGYLTKMYYTPELLHQFLGPKIAKKEWDMVAQLAFQIQSSQVYQASDSLILSLLRSAEISDVEAHRVNYLEFAARSLQFLVPRPTTTRSVVNACVVSSILWSAQRNLAFNAIGADVYEILDIPQVLMTALSSARQENRQTISKQVIESLSELLEGSDETLVPLAFEFLFSLEMLCQGRPLDTESIPVGWLTHAVQDQVLHQRLHLLLRHADQFFFPCLKLFWLGHVTLGQMALWHGIESLFTEHQLTIAPPRKQLSAVHRVLQLVPTGSITSQLAELSPYLVEGAVPWLQRPCTTSFPTLERPDSAKRDTSTWPPGASFALFAILAVMSESVRVPKWNLVDKCLPSKVKNLSRLLKARYEVAYPRTADEMMKSLGWSTKQRHLAEMWIRSDLHLCSQGSSIQIVLSLDSDALDN